MNKAFKGYLQIFGRIWQPDYEHTRDTWKTCGLLLDNPQLNANTMFSDAASRDPCEAKPTDASITNANMQSVSCIATSPLSTVSVFCFYPSCTRSTDRWATKRVARTLGLSNCSLIIFSLYTLTPCKWGIREIKPRKKRIPPEGCAESHQIGETALKLKP
jgi:hypothetical protein